MFIYTIKTKGFGGLKNLRKRERERERRGVRMGGGGKKSKVEKMKQTDRRSERGIDRMERMGNEKKKRKE